MATYGDLKTRIIAETNRDDLVDDYAVNLAQAIVEAIDHYATKRFWFNEVRTTAAMTIGNEYVAVPTGLRGIDMVWASIGPGYEVQKTDLDNIESLAHVGGNGQPSRWAYYAPSGAASLRFWPTPNSAYSLILIGTKDETTLSAPGDSNAWTLYAYDLIAARAKMLLCRDLFRDQVKAQTAAEAETDALTRLRGETNRRLGTGRVRAYL